VIDDTGLQAAKAATKVGCSSSAPNPEKIHRPSGRPVSQRQYPAAPRPSWYG
jgi:hypothetical protein